MSDIEKRAAAVDVGEHGLKKHNMKVSTVVFMIFCLCAAGAYGIEEMIPESGPGLTLIMLIVLPFIWSTPLGLVASELGSARPQEGGYYKWVQEACGEFWGFQAGWWRTISIYIDNTLYVILAGGYVANTWDLSWGTEMAFKIGMILVFTYINIRGVKDVGIVSTILSVLVIVAFGMVAICGFMNWNQNPFLPFTADGEIMGLSGIGFADWVYYIGMGIALGMWMYSGYESMSTIAGEVENPQVIPKATMITVPLIMCVYILPTMAGLGSMGEWGDWGTEAGSIGYADVVTRFWGPSFGLFFVIVAVLAQCSIYNTYIASGSRGFFALADDNLAPPILVKCDKKHGVPYVAVLSVAIVNIILCQFAFTTVVVIDVFLLVSSYVMIFISAMILRKRIPEEELKFKIPGGYGFLCVLCIVPCIIAFIAFFINGTDYFIGGMLGIVSGPVLYVIWKKMYGGLAKKDPVKYPVNPKTGLAVGDLKKISSIFCGLAALGGLAMAWLPWFEGEWGPDYYLEEYGSGFFSSFEGMLSAIKIAAVVFLIIGILCALIAVKVEPKKQIENKMTEEVA
ncbi:APC family permease [Sinanaerobacter chloroacetimidivorans]|jgi:amino acid transporter|uniref:APC family permease n=1 Tax=Sinanaerobacter chloroacetimidivorans TaxID=2818044 RepID=A0A8J7W1V3_9FIRM|nr:APC family permease [Sinanaerobacter chloroacetimidivorans]MBR0597603.1 APC family permease [Sinanaerobacter chloroacetimidivorans]